MAERPQDRVKRQFTATRPNQLWVANITFVASWSGLVYVAFVVDVHARRSDSCDNTLAETINDLYKAEVIYRRGPRRNLEAVEYATLEWVDWFNRRRLLEPIGNVPPAE